MPARIAPPPNALGVDGARGGWLCVVARREGAAIATDVELVASLADVVARAGAAPIGVDVPIGLPDETGLRPADRAARLALGPRRASVFAVPARYLLGAPDYAEARAVAVARDHAKPSIQAFGILPRIAEADALLARSPGLAERMVEVHPEVSFARLAGRALAAKKTPEGRDERLAALRPVFGDLDARLATLTLRRAQAAPDDVLDAYAAAWSALRYADYRHDTLGDGGVDVAGRPMRIVV